MQAPGLKFSFKSLEPINDFNEIYEKSELPINYFYVFLLKNEKEIYNYIDFNKFKYNRTKSMTISIDQHFKRNPIVKDLTFLYGNYKDKNISFVIDKTIADNHTFFEDFISKNNTQRKDHFYFDDFIYFWETFIMNYNIYNLQQILISVTLNNRLMDGYGPGISEFFTRSKLIPHGKSILNNKNKYSNEFLESMMDYALNDMKEFVKLNRRFKPHFEKFSHNLDDQLKFWDKLSHWMFHMTYLLLIFVICLGVYILVSY
ncbi:hypothetical protein TBLA_0E00820 [Henningerozyma blattae CBS 6284]|uniref:Uncharacterized protein n=1 Tax=Henningerozyma blattae (strain ATCC 34711 / CBS 6284 / DSM 70876 / NBRC 10599 / NRRL Y-10934 / UCD 77-7) TaxID=1071380 RepID=I2H441_HENB6|nr:hypothetical protein TBLA_0E00820 [Tetrapisispora blattae CBS 6284]CCH61143.1 hypothetical protein TBLA_0E00820 [Tetrapisispora blattae CBS 6284]